MLCTVQTSCVYSQRQQSTLFSSDIVYLIFFGAGGVIPITSLLTSTQFAFCMPIIIWAYDCYLKYIYVYFSTLAKATLFQFKPGMTRTRITHHVDDFTFYNFHVKCETRDLPETVDAHIHTLNVK